MLELHLELFHFLRPWWLLGVIPVLLIGWLLWHQGRARRGWHEVIAPHLTERLVLKSAKQQRQPLRWSLPLALLCLVFALAGPTWEQRPQPVYQLNAGQVIVMDLSMSMRATDLNPNRLEQMRFKAMSLANDYLDGETGLIAYAGDAFIISPLTRDAASLSNLIRALSPEIMPVQGSYPQSALELADQLLREAGYAEGDIYWFTDGIETRDQTELTNFVRNHPHRLAIMALGSEQGAPISLLDGNLLRDRGGDVVVPKLTPERLQTLAELSNGRFVQWRQDAQDLEYLSSLPPLSRDGSESDEQRGDAWYDMGPWLLLTSLLLFLPSARRGLLLLAGLGLLSSALLTPPVYAQQASSAASEDGLAWHQQLWQTPYQQADAAIQQEDYERAAQIATDPLQRGTANYKRGAYEQALQDFSQVDSAVGYYNQGNSLMKMERYDEAANVYREALRRDPNLQQAEQNLELAEQLAAAQQQQQQQQGEGEQQEGEQSQQDQQQSGEQNSDGSGEQQQEPEAGEQPQQQQSEEQRQAEAAESNEANAQDDREGEEQQAQMTPAEQLSEEQRQQLEQWLNRIEDNPAYLLQRKMLEEAKRRDRQSPPQGVEKQW